MKHSKYYKIALGGVFAAFVVIGTFIRVPVYLGDAVTMVHLGNAFCILAGVFLGPFYGGLAAGIGSFVFDLLDPIFLHSAFFSFVLKFLIGFISGLVIIKNKTNLNTIIVSTLGMVVYLFLYLLKNFIINFCFLGISMEATSILLIKSAAISTLNAVIAIVLSNAIGAFIKKRRKP